MRIMIYDTLENLQQYRSLFSHSSEFEETIKDLLCEISEGSVPLGRVERSEHIYTNVTEYETKPDASGCFETHREYADVQIMLSGKEYLYTSPMALLNETASYDPEADCSLQEGPRKSRVEMTPGTFVLILPGDPHMPSISPEHTNSVKKMVVKICMK